MIHEVSSELISYSCCLHFLLLNYNIRVVIRSSWFLTLRFFKLHRTRNTMSNVKGKNRVYDVWLQICVQNYLQKKKQIAKQSIDKGTYWTSSQIHRYRVRVLCTWHLRFKVETVQSPKYHSWCAPDCTNHKPHKIKSKIYCVHEKCSLTWYFKYFRYFNVTKKIWLVLYLLLMWAQ